jgi:glycosyltransferase involved in cell wall biosynthesis
VIAYAGGGALDTVVDGVTGKLFHPQTAEALADTVASFGDADYDPAAIRRNADRFDTACFKRDLLQWIQWNREQRQTASPLPFQAVTL